MTDNIGTRRQRLFCHQQQGSQRWEQPQHTLLYRTRAGSLHTLASSKVLQESQTGEHTARPTLWLELAFTIVLGKEP